jgi:pilus assembly protein CpaF
MSNLLEQEETNWDEDEIEEVDSQVVDSEFSQLRDKIHHQVLEVLDLSVVSQLSPEQLRQELKNLVIRIVNQQDHPLTSDEREELVSQIQHEVLGLGPLESLLADVTVNDILVNGALNGLGSWNGLR